MSDKAEWAYRTISEVSEELDVPPHVLRFWETKFSQLKPMKRSGSRRYYNANDLELLMRIRDLLYRDGFTIKGAQKALKEKKQDSQAEGITASSSSSAATSQPASAQAQLDITPPPSNGPSHKADVSKALTLLQGVDARIDRLLAGK